MIASDDEATWTAMLDVVLAILAVVLCAVSVVQAKQDGVPEKAAYLITIDWPVSVDADVDVHLLTPSGKPAFYGARQVGCARLDQDNKGFQDLYVRLADGSQTKLNSYKETVSLRCIEPGRYVAAANLFAWRDANGIGHHDRHDIGLKVHCEVVAVNPTVHLVWAGDVTLDSVGETINFSAFDLDASGAITLVDTPLTPITEGYSKPSNYTPGGQP